jgi:hypothetical protein
MYAGQDGASSLDALRHPLRVRIIEICTEWGPISPNEIVNRSLCADISSLKGKEPRTQLANISYHCRELEKAQLLTLEKERPVRGATEHFYSANSEAFFSDDEWAQLSKDEREEISPVMWQRFIAAVESAQRAGTFDARIDRMLGWGPLTLDEPGWTELASYMAGAFAGVDRIKGRSETRLTEPGAVPVRATYGLFCFEAPNPSEPRADD